MKYVQFSDDTQTKVLCVFANPQDAAYWPNQAELEDDDPRLVAFLSPSAAVVPSVVSMAQAQLALLQAGKLDAVESFMETASRASRIEWEKRSTVERDSPLVTQLAYVLNLTSADLDALFIAAAAL